MSALAISKAAPALYMLCEDLIAYLETVEMTEPGTPEREECEAALALYMEQLPAKVDRVSWVLVHLESQMKAAAEEMKRLQARKQSFERAFGVLESYCVKVIEKLPEPKKGARKLEGSTTTLSIRPSEGTVINDEAAVPCAYKTACVEMPAREWEMVVDLYPQVVESLTKQDLKIRLSDIKKDLKAGIQIAGADLEFRYNLTRR